MRPDTAVLNPSLPALWSGVAPSFLNIGTRRTLAVYPDDSGWLDDGTPYGWANQAAFNAAFAAQTGINRYGLPLVAASSQYLEIADNAPIQIAGSFTLAAWVQWQSNSDGPIFHKWANPLAHGYTLEIYGGKLTLVTGASSVRYVQGTTGFNATSPMRHVAGVWNGTDLRVYVDGALDCTPQSGWNPADSGTVLRIGRRTDTAVYSFCIVADPIILPFAVSAGLGSQLAALADATDPSCGGLIRLTTTTPVVARLVRPLIRPLIRPMIGAY